VAYDQKIVGGYFSQVEVEGLKILGVKMEVI